MTNMYCLVKGCPFYILYAGRRDNVRVFSFPTDEAMREIWFACTGWKNTKRNKPYGICSRHFGSSDYIRDSKTNILFLKEDAFPSYNLPQGISIEEVQDDLSVEVDAGFEPGTELIPVINDEPGEDEGNILCYAVDNNHEPVGEVNETSVATNSRKRKRSNIKPVLAQVLALKIKQKLMQKGRVNSAMEEASTSKESAHEAVESLPHEKVESGPSQPKQRRNSVEIVENQVETVEINDSDSEMEESKSPSIPVDNKIIPVALVDDNWANWELEDHLLPIYENLTLEESNYLDAYEQNFPNKQMPSEFALLEKMVGFEKVTHAALQEIVSLEQQLPTLAEFMSNYIYGKHTSKAEMCLFKHITNILEYLNKLKSRLVGIQGMAIRLTLAIRKLIRTKKCKVQCKQTAKEIIANITSVTTNLNLIKMDTVSLQVLNEKDFAIPDLDVKVKKIKDLCALTEHHVKDLDNIIELDAEVVEECVEIPAGRQKNQLQFEPAPVRVRKQKLPSLTGGFIKRHKLKTTGSILPSIKKSKLNETVEPETSNEPRFVMEPQFDTEIGEESPYDIIKIEDDNILLHDTQEIQMSTTIKAIEPSTAIEVKDIPRIILIEPNIDLDEDAITSIRKNLLNDDKSIAVKKADGTISIYCCNDLRTLAPDGTEIHYKVLATNKKKQSTLLYTEEAELVYSQILQEIKDGICDFKDKIVLIETNEINHADDANEIEEVEIKEEVQCI